MKTEKLCRDTARATDLTAKPEEEIFQEEAIERFHQYINSKTWCQMTVRKTEGLEKSYERDFYVHYRYKDPPDLFLAFNARGLVINLEYQSPTATPVENLEELRPTCKPVLLCPTVEYWWHRKSRLLLLEQLMQLKRDAIKASIDSAPLRAFIQLNHLHFEEKLEEALEKITSRRRNDGRAALFSIRVPSTSERKSRITVPIYTLNESKSIESSDWSILLPATNIACMGIIRVRGIRVTRHTVSIDLELAYVLQIPLKVSIKNNLDDLEFTF